MAKSLHIGAWLVILFADASWVNIEGFLIACLLSALAMWRSMPWSSQALWVSLSAAMCYHALTPTLDVSRSYDSPGISLSRHLFQDSIGLVWVTDRRLPLDARLQVTGTVSPWSDRVIPMGFNPEQVYGPRGAVGLLHVSVMDSLGMQGSWTAKVKRRWRKWVKKQPWPKDLQGLGLALTLGDRSMLSYPWKQAFIDAGMAHVLALSGFHLGLITMVFQWMRSLFPARWRPWWMLIGGLCTWVLVPLVQSPSVLRAAFFLTIMQVLALRSQQSSSMDRAHLAGFLLLLLWPDLGKQMSFQLSMTAVMAIIFIQSPHGKTIQSKILGIAMVSLAAQWATLPLIAMTFHRFPWGFLFANLLLLPLVMLIYPLVALSVALSWFSLALPVSDSVMDGAFRLISAFHYTMDGMHPDAWLVAIMGLAALVGLQALKTRRLLPLVLPLMATGLAMHASLPSPHQGEFAYRQGQGMAIGVFHGDSVMIYATRGLSLNDWLWDKAFQGLWEGYGIEKRGYQIMPFEQIQARFDDLGIAIHRQGFTWLNQPTRIARSQPAWPPWGHAP